MRGTLGLAAITFTSLAFLASRGETVRPLEAGTALRMDLGEIVGRSELVLEARVVSTTPVEGPGGLVWTDAQLLVDRTFLGADQGVRTVRLPGGVLPSGRGTVVPGMPTLVPGEDVFLMLTGASESGGRVVVGLSQGRFRVVRDVTGARFAVRRNGGGVLVDGVTGHVTPEGSREVIEYAEMVAMLESAAAATRAGRGDAGGEGR